MQSPTIERIQLGLVVTASVLLALALAGANVWLGNLNQDEGWYLYAAQQAARGLEPYRDFFFTQGPLMPRVYGWLTPLWSPAGVAGGRVLTALLGLLGSSLTALLAASVMPPHRRLAAGITAFLLTAGNVHHSYFTAIPKTYALASVLLVGGLLAVEASVRFRRSALAAVGGALLAGAAGTRISLGAALLTGGVWLLLRAHQARAAWFWFGLGGALSLVAIYLPSILADPAAFRFANTFHTGRAGGGLLFVAGSLSRLARGYLPLAGVSLAAIVAARAAPPTMRATMAHATGPALWMTVFAAVFSIHLLSPFPYDDYQVPIMPLLAAAVSVLFWHAVPAACPQVDRAPHGRLAVLAGLWLWASVTAFASPLNQDWFVIRQDRFWVVTKPQPDLVQLRQVARWIRSHAALTDRLLTQDTYLAVETGLQVPEGFEMGPFGYFPELPDAQAQALHVLNRSRLLAALEAGEAPLAAFSGYGLAIGAPAMTELPAEAQRELRDALARRYALIGTIGDFGQGHTALELWTRKPVTAPAASQP